MTSEKFKTLERRLDKLEKSLDSVRKSQWKHLATLSTLIIADVLTHLSTIPMR